MQFKGRQKYNIIILQDLDKYKNNWKKWKRVKEKKKREKKKEESPFTRRGAALLFNLWAFSLYKLRFAELYLAARVGHHMNIHVCCARPRSRCNNLPAGWYVIECKAQQKYAWVHPLGFTMGATTLNLFTHLLIRSCTPLMLTQPCRRNNSYDIYLLNPFFPIIHYI